jgi:hypothetical protein
VVSGEQDLDLLDLLVVGVLHGDERVSVLLEGRGVADRVQQ